MCCMASTRGTMPGFFVTSMCSIVLLKYFDLSAFWFALSGVVLSSAMGATPFSGEARSIKAKKPPRPTTVCRFGDDTRHCGPGWLSTLRYLRQVVRGGQENVR